MGVRQLYWHHAGPREMGEDTFSCCPMCGAPLARKIIDHRPRRACPECGYVHFRNPAPTVSLLIIEGERVLLGKRPGDPGQPETSGQDRWATPSGYIEFDEDFLETAAREAKEETGLDITIAAILNVTDSFFPPDQHYLNIYLLAHPAGGQIQPGDDMGELRWFPIAGPFPEMAFQEDVDMIQRYRQPSAAWLPIEERAR